MGQVRNNYAPKYVCGLSAAQSSLCMCVCMRFWLLQVDPSHEDARLRRDYASRCDRIVIVHLHLARHNYKRSILFDLTIVSKNFSRDRSYGARRIESLPILSQTRISRFETVNIEKVPFSRDPRSKTEINIRFFPSSSAAFSFASFRSVRDRAYVGEDRATGGWER